MQFLFDLFPLILFFIANKMYDIYVATGVAIAATAVQVLIVWLRHGEVKKQYWITLVVLVVLGGMTIFLRNDLFIKWKPTVLYGVFALVVIGSQFIGQKPLMKRLMGAQIDLPDYIWARVNSSWAIFFALMAALNVYVAFYYRLDLPAEARTDLWVNFKVFWLMGLTLVFTLVQMLFLAKHIDPEKLEKAQKGADSSEGEEG